MNFKQTTTHVLILTKGFQPIVHHRTAKLGSQICSTRPRPRRYHESCKVKKIPSKYYWLAGKHMNKVLRWAFMMYHRVDDRALFFFWVPCWLAYLLGGCAALNSNQYFEGVVLFQAQCLANGHVVKVPYGLCYEGIFKGCVILLSQNQLFILIKTNKQPSLKNSFQFVSHFYLIQKRKN